MVTRDCCLDVKSVMLTLTIRLIKILHLLRTKFVNLSDLYIQHQTSIKKIIMCFVAFILFLISHDQHLLCVVHFALDITRSRYALWLVWWNGIVMVFNATFNNISVISWRSVSLVKETVKNHQLAASH
jgi:hypothetical protein